MCMLTLALYWEGPLDCHNNLLSPPWSFQQGTLNFHVDLSSQFGLAVLLVLDLHFPLLKSYKGKMNRNFAKDLPLIFCMSLLFFFDYLFLFDCLGIEQILLVWLYNSCVDLLYLGGYFRRGIVIRILIHHSLLYMKTNVILENIVNFLQYNSIPSYLLCAIIILFIKATCIINSTIQR